jgi:excisionase family DNA binding protein
MEAKDKIKGLKMDSNKEHITVPEAAKLAGVSNETIRNWIRDFKIGFKVAGRWHVYKEGLKDIMDGKITYETQGRPKENS